MKTLTEQLKELSRGAYYISPELKDEIIKIIKERDAYVIGENEAPGDSSAIEEVIVRNMNDLKERQRKRSDESL